MITSSTALGILRHLLSRNIGMERIKGFLIRVGWEMRENDAQQALKTDISLEAFYLEKLFRLCVTNYQWGMRQTKYSTSCVTSVLVLPMCRTPPDVSLLYKGDNAMVFSI